MRQQNEIEDVAKPVFVAWIVNRDHYVEGLMVSLQWVFHPESEDPELD